VCIHYSYVINFLSESSGLYIYHSPSDTSEEEFQIDEIVTTSATSDDSTNSKQINVLTQDPEFILEAIKRLDDPHLLKTYLDKLLQDFNQPEHPSSNPIYRYFVCYHLLKKKVCKSSHLLKLVRGSKRNTLLKA
jgi:hypothetical protein